MTHSVSAYISRLTTQQLEAFLWEYRQGRQTEDFQNVIPLVIQELSRRKDCQALPEK